jgi:hypothetical protein
VFNATVERSRGSRSSHRRGAGVPFVPLVPVAEDRADSPKVADFDVRTAERHSA